MVSQSGPVGYMEKTADNTDVQKRVPNTLHNKTKPQKLVVKTAVSVCIHEGVQTTWITQGLESEAQIHVA